MTISDGFNKANSLGELPGNVLFSEVSDGGAIIKAYLQECAEMADQGEHGWFHVGLDVIEAETGKVLDSIPVSRAAEDGTDNPGHYKRAEAERMANFLLQDYLVTVAKAKAADAAQGREFDQRTWLNTFSEMKKLRSQETGLLGLLLALLSDDKDDEDTIGTITPTSDRVLPRSGGLDALLEKLLSDFDPDGVEPTDEGLDDTELDQTDTSK